MTFDVRRGTAMGIIGSNGAGKSTLMRAMAGILPPTAGSIEVWGKASTLLALGVGFNQRPVRPGEHRPRRARLRAVPREVEERADEVAEWTELGDFIDMPMRTYSSGMSARVAFSVAVHMKPDILMIDEALSTGDAHFREKANAKMAELRDERPGHVPGQPRPGQHQGDVQRGIWLDKGKLMMRGEPDEVIDAYMKFVKVKKSATDHRGHLELADHARPDAGSATQPALQPPAQELGQVAGLAVPAALADDQWRRGRPELHPA